MSGSIAVVIATPLPPTLSFLFRLEVQVGAPVDLGVVGGEDRRIVPILSGTIEGPEIRGTVLDGGADFQVLHPDGRQMLEARYGIETDDGVRMYVENRGLRAGSAEDLGRIAKGERVDPARIYFRSQPQLFAPAGPWEWLNSRMFVGVGERAPLGVRLDVFVID